MTEYEKPHSERDYYRCAYAPAATTPFATPISKLPTLAINEGFTAELNVTLTPAGSQLRITKGRNETNINQVKWYVARWSADSGMQIEDDEQIPMSLLPEGRIENPIRQPRKTPRRRPVVPDTTQVPKASKKNKNPRTTIAPVLQGRHKQAKKALAVDRVICVEDNEDSAEDSNRSADVDAGRGDLNFV